MSTLKAYLKEWNGKDHHYLQDCYQVFGQEADLIQQLTRLASRYQPLLPAATWLIKHHLAVQSTRVSKDEQRMILDLFPKAVTWQTQLHLLQSLPHLALSKTEAESILPLVDANLSHQNKFVRAWSYNALAMLCRYIPELLPEVQERFSLALEEEAASVKARIRNTIKEQKWPIA